MRSYLQAQQLFQDIQQNHCNTDKIIEFICKRIRCQEKFRLLAEQYLSLIPQQLKEIAILRVKDKLQNQQWKQIKQKQYGHIILEDIRQNIYNARYEQAQKKKWLKKIRKMYGHNTLKRSKTVQTII